MPLQDAINRLICGDENLNQGCDGNDGGNSSDLEILLQQILEELQNQEPVEATLFVACELPLDDPPTRFLVEAVYDESSQIWRYRRASDQSIVVEGVDFAICADNEVVPQVCEPWMLSYRADEPPTSVEPFNSFAIYKPGCCAIKVTTSAGGIVLPKGIQAYSPEKFDCNLTSIEIEGDCLDKVNVFLQRTGVLTT